jgi:hypothetical protein
MYQIIAVTGVRSVPFCRVAVAIDAHKPMSVRFEMSFRTSFWLSYFAPGWCVAELLKKSEWTT